MKSLTTQYAFVRVPSANGGPSAGACGVSTSGAYARANAQHTYAAASLTCAPTECGPLRTSYDNAVATCGTASGRRAGRRSPRRDNSASARQAPCHVASLSVGSKHSRTDMTTSSPSSAGSLAVTRPNPFAADHRTTVSLSRNATSSASMTSSTPSGMSQSSSSSSGWGVTLGVFTAATAAPPAAKLSSSDRAPRWYLHVTTRGFKNSSPIRCVSLHASWRTSADPRALSDAAKSRASLHDLSATSSSAALVPSLKIAASALATPGTKGRSVRANVGVEFKGLKGVRSGVVRRRGRGMKPRDPGRRDAPGKVLKDRRSPRRRGRMGTSQCVVERACAPSPSPPRAPRGRPSACLLNASLDARDTNDDASLELRAELDVDVDGGAAAAGSVLFAPRRDDVSPILPAPAAAAAASLSRSPFVFPSFASFRDTSFLNDTFSFVGLGGVAGAAGADVVAAAAAVAVVFLGESDADECGRFSASAAAAARACSAAFRRRSPVRARKGEGMRRSRGDDVVSERTSRVSARRGRRDGEDE
eukprot:31373-Pelagococcus_subviridis.AAC.4